MFELAKIMINHWRKDIVATGNDATLIRGLTRTQVLNQLDAMMNLIHDQINIGGCNDGGWFCGPIAALGAAAINNPMAYASIVYDLATTGKSNAGGAKNTLSLPSWVAAADMTSGKFLPPNGDIGKDQMAIDYIMVFALRASENDGFAKGADLINNYKQNAAGTLPWEMNDLLERLGMGVASQSFYLGQSNRTLGKLEKAIKNGYTPIIFDNEIIAQTNRNGVVEHSKEKTPLGGGINLDLGIHYIVLLDFKRDKQNKTVSYTIIESGKKTTHNNVSYKLFKKGMKGFWIPKNKK